MLGSHVRFDEAACKLKIKANNYELVRQKEVDYLIQAFNTRQESSHGVVEVKHMASLSADNPTAPLRFYNEIRDSHLQRRSVHR